MPLFPLLLKTTNRALVLERGKMTPLVLFDSLDLSKASNEDFYTTTEIIAEQTGNSYKVISDRIRQYHKKLEAIAPLRFSFLKTLNSKGGRPKKIYHLNKQQALSFVPLLENTEQVVNFTFALAEAFVNMEKELQARKIARISEKAVKRNLNEVIEHWENAPKFAYSNMNKLLIKLATGQPVKTVKARDVTQDIMLNLLTSIEQKNYVELEQVAIGLIMANLEYKFIKALLEKVATKKLSETLASDDSF